MTHLKLQKLGKGDYPPAHRHLGDVLVGNHLFVIFAVLDVSFAVNSCLNLSFLHLYFELPELPVFLTNEGKTTEHLEFCHALLPCVCLVCLFNAPC